MISWILILEVNEFLNYSLWTVFGCWNRQMELFSCSCLGYLLEREKTHNSTATIKSQIDWFLLEDRKTCPFLLCDKRSSELNKVILNKMDPLSLGLKFCFFPSENTYQNHFTLKSYITLRWNIKKSDFI